MSEPTAVRTWNRTHTKATVTVTLPDGQVVSLGGKRAERAQAALIMEDYDYDYSTTPPTPIVTGAWRADGLRADYAKAQGEAAKWRSDRPERYRGIGGTYTTGHIIPGREALAIEVVDA